MKRGPAKVGFIYEPTVTAIEPQRGPSGGGTAVTIRGLAFKGLIFFGPLVEIVAPTVQDVMFGSTPATSVDVVSESEITAVSPPGEGTVNVTVGSAGFSSPDVQGDLFSYPSRPVITTSNLPEGQLGTTHPQTLSATGGTYPYSWTLTGGSLPEGLELASDGAITGTPSATGSASFTVKVTNGEGETASASLSINVHGGLKAGDPELFSNGVRTGGESEAIAQLVYGGVDVKSAAIPEGELECGGLALVSGWNSGSPSRMHGRILSWSAQGHAPTGEHAELGAACRGGGGSAFVTDERPLAAVSAGEATRGSETVPWNVEAICVVHEHEKVTVVKIGVPDGALEDKSGCESAEAEASEADAELASREGCYKSIPRRRGASTWSSSTPASGSKWASGGR